MKLALFYDFETQALPLFKEPSEHPGQPHFVQVGAELVDLETRRVFSTLDVVVKPDGWTIPDDTAAIHGITTEMALDVGIPEHLALRMLLAMWRRAEVHIGHNETFDARIARIACMRFLDEATADDWKAGAAECTQLISTPILKLPPTDKMRRAGFFKHKSANLGEAYEFFTGKKLEGAHSAIVDVRACQEVYFAAKSPMGAALDVIEA